MEQILADVDRCSTTVRSCASARSTAPLNRASDYSNAPMLRCLMAMFQERSPSAYSGHLSATVYRHQQRPPPPCSAAAPPSEQCRPRWRRCRDALRRSGARGEALWAPGASLPRNRQVRFLKRSPRCRFRGCRSGGSAGRATGGAFNGSRAAPYSTLITPKTPPLFHAEFHSCREHEAMGGNTLLPE